LPGAVTTDLAAGSRFALQTAPVVRRNAVACFDLKTVRQIGRDAMLRRFVARCARGAARPSLIVALRGALVATCFATICQQVIILLGTSLPVTIPLFFAAAIGGGAGFSIPRRTSRTKAATERALLCLALTAWMIVTPWLLQWTDWVIARPRMLEPSAGHNTLVMLVLCLGLAGIPAAMIARLSAGLAAPGPAHPGWLLVGAAGGVAGWGLGFALLLGPWGCGVAAASLGLAIALVEHLRSTDPLPENLADPRVDGAGGIESSAAAEAGIAGGLRLCLDGILVIGFGGLLAAVGRVVEQLQPGTIYLVCAEAAGILLGLGAGVLGLQSRWGHALASRRGRLVSCGVLAGWSVLLLAAFPWLIQGALWLNACIAAPTLLISVRGCAVALAVFPIGWTAAVCLAANAPCVLSATGKTRWWLICAVAGYCGTLPAGERGWDPENVVIGLAWWIAVAGGLRFGRWPVLSFVNRLARFRTADSTGREHGRRWLRPALYSTLVAGIAAAPLWRTNCDERLSSRLLFNTNVFVGYRMGYGPALLPFLDEARHLGTVHGSRGTMTVWKYGGTQVQLRENGMPAGVISCDPDLFPRLLPETLQAALPLVLHHKPQSLLLLGLGSGESLLTGLAFPLPEIVCWEPDAGRVRALREIVARELDYNPLADERVQLTVADPAFALDAEPRRFDAIVSTPDHAALLRTQAYFSRAFYERVARRLAPRGVFCQRVQFIDLGPRPLQAIVRTMQSVFRDVLALEVAPGELLLAAAAEPDGTLQPDLMKRLQFPHLRGILAQSGIDWSVILNLPAYRNEALARFATEGARRLNLADNSRLTFALPRDVMRWGAKLQEVQLALGPHVGRLAAWIGEDGESPELVRRLSEVTGQQEIMSKYSDQYWSYRATLRTQLTQKSRSKIQQKIQQASATDETPAMHPEDRRRLRYFTALGRATKTHSPQDILALERFEFPYDPLLSYFVHLEAAELHANADGRDVRQELRHRLHAVWFSSARDTSLRNVIAAMKLVRDFPAAEPDPVQRWDTLNALVQALQQRWDARAGVHPTNIKRVIEDIDATVLAAEETFLAMDELTKEAGLPPENWAARERALEKTLIRPVKAYRSDLLPLLQRKEARKHAKNEAAADGEPARLDEAAPAEPAGGSHADDIHPRPLTD
jgi:hypothetical protein